MSVYCIHTVFIAGMVFQSIMGKTDFRKSGKTICLWISYNIVFVWENSFPSRNIQFIAV